MKWNGKLTHAASINVQVIFSSSTRTRPRVQIPKRHFGGIVNICLCLKRGDEKRRNSWFCSVVTSHVYTLVDVWSEIECLPSSLLRVLNLNLDDSIFCISWETCCPCGTPVFRTAAFVWFATKKSNARKINFSTTHFNCVNNKCNE